MKRFRDSQPIRHAVFWIVLYIAAVNVGDALSASVGVPNVITAPLLVALSVVLLLYLRAHGLFTHYGLMMPTRSTFGAVWWFAPLALIALLPPLLGSDAGLGMGGSLLAIVLMLGVGFLEELIFRGFLYRAIERSSGMWRAIVISGVTFGIGHVVNLLRGYSGGEQLVQVIVGIAVGFVLAMLFALTGSILPGVLFHAALNTGGTLTQRALSGDVAVMAITLVVCAVYAARLVRDLRIREGRGGIGTKLGTATVSG